MLEQLKNMSAAELNTKMNAFGKDFGNDKESVKKIGACLLLAAVLVVGGQVAGTHLKSSVAAAMEKRDEYKNIQTYLDTYNKDSKAYKEEASKITTKLLEADEVDKGLTIIQKTAEANGVHVVSTNRQDKAVQVGSGVQSHEIKIVLSGNYGDIIKTIDKIENATFFTALKSVSMKPEEKATAGQGKILATIDYFVFFAKPDKGGSGK